MATFTKLELFLLCPCNPWCQRIFDYANDPISGTEMKTYLEDAGEERMLAWLMAGSVALATDLIEIAGTDVNMKDPVGKTALSWAIIKRKVDVVTYLLTQGANKDIEDNERRTPKRFALSSEDVDIKTAMGV